MGELGSEVGVLPLGQVGWAGPMLQLGGGRQGHGAPFQGFQSGQDRAHGFFEH